MANFPAFSRLWLLLLLLAGLYVTTTYVISNSAEDGSMDDMANETGFAEGQNGIFQLQSGLKLGQSVIPNEVVFLPPSIKYGETLVNCGLTQGCSDGEFSVHIYTGKDHKDEPRLCVDGKYVLSKDVNNAGRGINAVIIDSMTKTVTKVNHFDTYDKESTALETLLLTLRPGDIVILLTFDEPTRKLSRVAKLLLYELGSSLIQNLSYRGSWYLVTQKGLNGFTPYEALHIVGSSGWPKHHDVHFCVPLQIKGQTVHPDPLPRTNQPRVEFCEKCDDCPIFCDADVVNDPLQPAALMKHSGSVGRIYSTPVVVMSGDDVSYLPVMLETLLRQSGINPSLVVVFYLPQNKQVPKLCDLFGFMSVEITLTDSYCESVKEAFETAGLLFPDAKELVLLSDNIVLAPDFLYFMGQLLPLLQLDPSIISISAFNENGFKGDREDLSLLYRVESFSGISVLLRKDFFQKSWCANDSDSDPLYITNEIQGDSVVPEVSRVLIIPHIINDDYDNDLWLSVLAHDRAVSHDDYVPLKDAESLVSNLYNDHINKLLKSSKSLPIGSFEDNVCSLDPETDHDEVFDLTSLLNANSSENVYAIYVHQSDENDIVAFHLICRCFQLLFHPPYTPRGMYRNVLRFFWLGNQILAVGSASPFYHYKPPNLTPMIVSHVDTDVFG